MSGTVLLLQSSSGNLAVGFGQDGDLIHDSSGDADLARSRDIRRAIALGLDATGLRLADFSRICVDIGPGGLGATRTSVAFANALGFALDVPVIGVPAFDLLGFAAARATDRPVRIARRAARPHLFLGRYDGDTLESFDYVTEPAAARAIAAEPAPIALAGNMGFAHAGTDLAPLTNAAPMRDFLTLVTRPAYLPRADRAAAPITENL